MSAATLPQISRATTTAGSVRNGAPGFALAAAMLGFAVVALDAQVVNVALPDIRGDLGGGLSGLQWVVTGYTLTFSALQLFAGSLSDRLGSRRAYGLGMALFVAASALCGIAPTLSMLVAARVVQGVGAALVTPTSLALIREAYTDARSRGRAIAYWAMGGSVAAAAGPVLGGALTALDWRLISFVNLPAGAVVLAAVAVTVVALVVFIAAQARGRHPMVPLDLFSSPAVATALVVAFVSMAAFYGVVFVQSLYFQQQRGLSPLITGLLFLPMTGLVAAPNPLVARVMERHGRLLPIVSGQVAMVAGLVAPSLLPADAPVLLVAAAMVPVGVGGSFTVPPVTALLLEHVPAHRAGTASGVLSTARQLGGSLGVAAYGAVVAGQATFQAGLRTSLLAAAVVLALLAAAALAQLRDA